jgi:hypothetical protein
MTEKGLIFKFNGGVGAVLCNNCRVIVDSHLNPMEAQEAYPQGVICLPCQKKGIKKI